MKKTKNDQSSQNSNSMLGQKTGSMLDLKTNEDFNNEHPDHNDTGLTQIDPKSDDKKSTKKINTNKK